MNTKILILASVLLTPSVLAQNIDKLNYSGFIDSLLGDGFVMMEGESLSAETEELYRNLCLKMSSDNVSGAFLADKRLSKETKSLWMQFKEKGDQACPKNPLKNIMGVMYHTMNNTHLDLLAFEGAQKTITERAVAWSSGISAIRNIVWDYNKADCQFANSSNSDARLFNCSLSDNTEKYKIRCTIKISDANSSTAASCHSYAAVIES